MTAINKKKNRQQETNSLFSGLHLLPYALGHGLLLRQTQWSYRIERSIISRLYLQLLIINSYCLVIFLARNSLSSQSLKRIGGLDRAVQLGGQPIYRYIITSHYKTTFLYCCEITLYTNNSEFRVKTEACVPVIYMSTLTLCVWFTYIILTSKMQPRRNILQRSAYKEYFTEKF
jgi:hypothetical protein